MMRNFDLLTITTVTGEVAAVRKVGGRRGEGTHVDLKANDATYDVHLGPASFLSAKSLELRQATRLRPRAPRSRFAASPLSSRNP